MKTLTTLKITAFFEKKDINPFKFNNVLYNFFSSELGEAQPNVVNPQPMKNNVLPICVWDSKFFNVLYGVNRIELNFKTIDENDLDKKKQLIINFFNAADLSINRIGTIVVFEVDEDFNQTFCSIHKFDFKSAPEFNCSWVQFDKVNDTLINIWTHYQVNKNKKIVLFDVNTSNDNNEINFEKSFDDCFKLTYREVNKYAK